MAGELKPASLMTAVPESEGPNILDYLGMFRRRLRTIIVPALILALAGAGLALILPDEFEASTRFVVQDPGLMKDVVGIGGVIPPHKPFLIRAEDEMKSPGFLRPIINRIGISEGYNVSRPDEYAKLLDRIRRRLTVRIDKAPTGPDRIEISYRGRNQDKVVQFVDAVRETYRDLFRDQYRRTPRDWYTQATAAVDSIENRLAVARADLQAHAATPDVALLFRGQEYRREAELLRLDRDKSRGQLSGLRTKLERAQNQLREMPEETRRRRLVDNPDKLLLAEELETAKAELNTLINKGRTDITKEVNAARALVTRLQADLAALPDQIEETAEIEVNTQRAALSLEILNYSREIEAVELEIRRQTRRLEELDGLLRRVPEVEARDLALKGEIESIERQLANARAASQRATDSWNRVRDDNLFRVLEYPHANDPAVFPSLPLFILIGLAVGFFLGLGLAFLKEFSGMTYATSAQVKHAMPLPVLGEISRILSRDEERRESRRRRRSFGLVAAVVLVLGLIHLCYFRTDLQSWLPAPLTSVLDKIYLGR